MSLGMLPPKQSSSPFHIGVRSYSSGGITWRRSSLPNNSMHTTSLLPLTRQLEPESEEGRQFYSQTATSSHISIQPFSFQMASRLDRLGGEEMENKELEHSLPKSAEGSTVRTVAEAQQEPVVSDTPVLNASSLAMAKKTALSRCEVRYGMRPKYLRYNVWEAHSGGEQEDVQVNSLHSFH